jgi:hypothetical protein
MDQLDEMEPMIAFRDSALREQPRSTKIDFGNNRW